jgi:hypothetical protein
MSAPMTGSMWALGFRNAFLCGLGVLVSIVGLAALVAVVSDQPFTTAAWMTFNIMCGLSILSYMFKWLQGKLMAGPVLLDCGAHPMAWLFVFNVVIFLAIAIPGGPMSNSRSGLMSGWFFGPMAFFFLTMAIGRLQVRTNGIWSYFGLLRWDKIASYEWSQDTVLSFKVRGIWRWFRGAVAVPPEHREAFDRLLTEHLGSKLS